CARSIRRSPTPRSFASARSRPASRPPWCQPLVHPTQQAAPFVRAAPVETQTSIDPQSSQSSCRALRQSPPSRKLSARGRAESLALARGRSQAAQSREEAPCETLDHLEQLPPRIPAADPSTYTLEPPRLYAAKLHRSNAHRGRCPEGCKQRRPHRVEIQGCLRLVRGFSNQNPAPAVGARRVFRKCSIFSSLLPAAQIRRAYRSAASRLEPPAESCKYSSETGN